MGRVPPASGLLPRSLGAPPRYSRSQFAALRLFPTTGWALNRLASTPTSSTSSSDTSTPTICSSTSVRSGRGTQAPSTTTSRLTSFILLSDVTQLDGPTALVLIAHSEHISKVPDDTEPGWPLSVPRGTFSDVEVLAMAPAGARAVRFPPSGDPYWNDQTASDVQQRYPNIDMTPYEVVN